MDMISLLSDDLVFRILSSVSTKDVLAISCVSKRWKPILNLVSSFEFDDTNHDYNYQRFTQFVYKTLMLNKSPAIEKLNLNLGPNCDAVDVRTWIEAAVYRDLRELKVKIRTELGLGLGLWLGPPSVSLPSSVLTCKTLESLTLVNCLLVLDVVPSCCLPSLESLRLKQVSYASLPKLLSGCPKLESLTLIVEEEDHGGENIIVAMPCLRKLDLFDSRVESQGVEYVIEAPCVEDLKIVDDFVYETRRIENMPNLVKAHVDITQGVTHEFLRALASAKSLYLCVSLLSKAPSLNIFFYRLVDLELNTCAQDWWELLTYMLQNSPKLTSLKLTDEHVLDYLSSKKTPDFWIRPSSIPKSLETFEWSGYKGRRGDLEMATYFIKNATSLKTATFSPQNNSDYESKFRMLKDLVSVSLPSTSPSFRLIFN